MDKFAEYVRDAEVRGVLGACVHSGILPELSEAGFDKLASDVCDKLGDNVDYSIDDVMQATADCLNEAAEKTASEAPAEEAPAEAEEGEEKTASEEDIDTAVQLALGDLFMQKIANQLDDEAFIAGTEAILKEAADMKKTCKKVAKEVKKALPSAKEVKEIIVDGAKGKDIAKAVTKGDAKLLAKALGRTGAVYAAPSAALAAAVEKLTD